MLLDVGELLFVWLGMDSNAKERSDAMATAKVVENKGINIRGFIQNTLFIAQCMSVSIKPEFSSPV